LTVTLPLRAVTLVLALVAILVAPSVAPASHAPPGTKLWAYQANVPPTARIYQYDIGTDMFEADCLPTPSGNGRAIAFDPQDSNLWYAFIGPPDGYIHKTTRPPGCRHVTQIPFGDGPGGVTQDDIGALDLDPGSNRLWAAGYTPVANRQVLYEVNTSNGAILRACSVAKALFDPGGNDTLAVTHEITGLTDGTYLVTDAGEFNTLDPLQVVDAASATAYTGPAGVPPCAIVTSFDPPVGVTGIDFLDPPFNDLIATDQNLIYDFGNAPYLLTEALMPAVPGTGLEDISVGVPGELSAEPFMLDLTPKTSTNTVETPHCVTATVVDESGQPVAGVMVVFDVSGVSDEDGSATTDSSGEATFCYTGPPVPGTDVIRAFADTDSDGTQDAPPPAGNEPADEATKIWIPPASTPGCDVKITQGGRIVTAEGDEATFGGNATVDGAGAASGQEEYQDHGPASDLDFHSLEIVSVVCSQDGKEASIFGDGTVDGSGEFGFRIRVRDQAEPGTGFDVYGIVIANGYASGDQTLVGGNVQVHR
jgi:Bacterial Ig-like domain (group 1)